ncbi:hypothetical protein N9Y42_07415 [Mariniblastus sp.]|nr:hypothetical protein [Mariniblastus sp.]
MIELNYSFRAGIGRFDTHDYVRAINIDVTSYDDECQEVVLGKICVDQVMIAAARIDGEDVDDIFDADSQGLHDAFSALFKADGELQEELDVNEYVSNLIFLWDATFHPVLEPYACGILDTIGTLFGEDSVFATWHKTTGLSDAKLVELGFNKIAGSHLIFRHSAFITPFSRQNPRGLNVPFDFQCSKEQEEWVLANWKNDRMAAE